LPLLFPDQRAQLSPQFDGWLAEHDGDEHQFEHHAVVLRRAHPAQLRARRHRADPPAPFLHRNE
jgi:hypothetical protein